MATPFAGGKNSFGIKIVAGKKRRREESNFIPTHPKFNLEAKIPSEYNFSREEKKTVSLVFLPAFPAYLIFAEGKAVSRRPVNSPY